MAVWYIVVLYLLVFGVLQLVVYRYLRGQDDGAASTSGSGSRAESAALEERRADLVGRSEERRLEGDAGAEREPAVDGGRAGDEPGVRHCPNCGAANEPEAIFTYCRNCAHQLGH